MGTVSFFITLIVTLFPTPSLPGCPPDVADYKLEGGKYFYVTPEKVPFAKARAECAKVDAALAEIGADTAEADTQALEAAGE